MARRASRRIRRAGYLIGRTGKSATAHRYRRVVPDSRNTAISVVSLPFL
jgi:hypothetical protein